MTFPLQSSINLHVVKTTLPVTMECLGQLKGSFRSRLVKYRCLLFLDSDRMIDVVASLFLTALFKFFPRSIIVSVCLSVNLSFFLSVYLSVTASAPFFISVYLSVCPSLSLSVCRSFCLSICHSVCVFLSVSLSRPLLSD